MSTHLRLLVAFSVDYHQILQIRSLLSPNLPKIPDRSPQSPSKERIHDGNESVLEIGFADLVAGDGGDIGSYGEYNGVVEVEFGSVVG